MTIWKFLVVVVFVALASSCSSKPEPSHISGNVTFKGKPVPAGWISFTPDVGQGQVRVYQIKDGVYDSSKETQPDLTPGTYQIKIAGFDGKKIPLWGQGKQIFNPVDDKHTVPSGTSTKDFVIPESAGHNVKIQPTADQ
jgi:hypothetical protein